MKTILNASIEKEIQKVSKAAELIWDKGWAERNGGNISVNLSKVATGIKPDYSKCRYVEITNFPKELSGKIFFVTGTGERIRDLEIPEESSCIIEFDKEVKGYYIIWGGVTKENFRPTSELISHMKLHLDLEKSPRGYSAVIHSHPTEVICLSHHPVLNKDEKTFNKAIWSMLPEVRAFVPRGVALLPYALPGSEELADLTVKGLRSHDVALWLKHGAVAAGKDVMEAFDFLDVANKGCNIYLKCLASGFTPEGMSQKEMDELVRAFNL
ncbi:MAG: rhamnulose-1-phosphate aldolase [Lentisphaerae bacterium GWF2_38_69]|nr:MAG: rhamnulose-1-phosphate aldolase [Lentisphaerae bacterium GWF2_38_69]